MFGKIFMSRLKLEKRLKRYSEILINLKQSENDMAILCIHIVDGIVKTQTQFHRNTYNMSKIYLLAFLTYMLSIKHVQL